MTAPLLALTIAELAQGHPAVAAFVIATDAAAAKPDRTLESWSANLSDAMLADLGLDREALLLHLAALAGEAAPAGPGLRVGSLRIIGGRDKSGRPERLDLTLRPGDVVCLVGPTGSGKSQLLADIECLAQSDTPSGRRVLVDGAPPDPAWRFAAGQRLIAQLSQNMNFVVDLTVAEFIAMHAECRGVTAGDPVAEVVACANRLAGERIAPGSALARLSGGQTRALMIADAAVLSASPIVLIDEIENAGIDRRQSLDLLMAREKIVLLSTHDPILALSGARRLAIANGAVAEVIETTAAERANLIQLERLDREMMRLRARIRAGERIDGALPWAAGFERT